MTCDFSLNVFCFSVKLLNCYYEAYQHISDLNEKRALASTITQIMHRRPRFDFAAKYFVSSYRVECCIFYKEMALLRDVLDKQVILAIST